ncbi:MAG: hypothetical protein KJ077_33640 [Anaerolineae bacterium]|nr:hypothetical protein [Anaerolineae bacterium]
MTPTEIEPAPPEFSPEEAELARQLLSLRQPPSPTLQRRVQAIPQPETPARTVPLGLVGGIIALVVVALLFASPPVKATLDEVQKAMGQIQLTIRSVWPAPTATVVLLETEPMPLPEAQAAVPFDFALPTYLPASLTSSDDEVEVAWSPVALVKMQWRDTQGGVVQLSIRAAGSENQPGQTLIGPESSETILLNGREVVLVRGGWDKESRTWSHQDQVITLIWTVHDVQYRLLSYSDAVSLTELKMMAASIR